MVALRFVSCPRGQFDLGFFAGSFDNRRKASALHELQDLLQLGFVAVFAGFSLAVSGSGDETSVFIVIQAELLLGDVNLGYNPFPHRVWVGAACRGLGGFCGGHKIAGRATRRLD